MRLLLALLVCVTAAAERPKLVQSLDVQIPVAPAPVTIAGKQVLAYELHLTNLRPVDVTLNRVEVRAGNITLAEYRDAELANRLGRPGGRPADKRVIGGGMRAVLYLWLPVEEVPARLQHAIETDAGVIESTVVDVRDAKSLVLDAPLRGGPWVALYNPLMIGGHRTAIYTMNGRARIPARFAIDWIRLDEEGASSRGDASKVASWYGYGADVLAVADGVIVEARDDVAGAESIGASQGAMPLELASGNYVILDLGGNRFAIYEHLKHGSIRVKTGDRVKRGQTIAQLGNTGSSSSGPHLHFHVADAGYTLEAEGQPYVFRSFEVIGAFDTIEAATSGKRWNAARSTRAMELPAANVVVMLP